MKKLYLTIGGGLLLLTGLIFFTHFAQAYVMPSVYVQELSLSKTEFQSGETVSGSFKIYSTADSIVPGVKYKFQVLGNIVDNVPTANYFEELGTETFTVNPKQAIIKNFSHQLPEGLAGEYLLRIALVNEQGLSLGWEDQQIVIKGVNSFVFLSEAYLIKDGKQILPQVGPTYSSEETPKIQFKVQNKSGNAISLIPKISIYERNPESNLVKSYEEQKIEIGANTSKVVNLELPKFTNPQVYLAVIKLFDNGKLASNGIAFRWVIAGQGANIWQTTADKTSYKTGEQAKITIFYTGPADASALDEGILVVSLLNSAGETVSQAQQNINLEAGKGQELSVLVDITKDVQSPVIKTDLLKDGKVLASQQVTVTAPAEPAKPTKGFPYFWLIVILLIIILIPVLKKFLIKKSPPALTLILLCFIGLLVLFANINTVKADVVVEKTTDNLTLTYVKPTHNQVFYIGGGINFTGSVGRTSCVNSLKSGYLSIYLTDANGENRYDLVKSFYIMQWATWDIKGIVPDPGFTGPARAYIHYIGAELEGYPFEFEIVAYEHIYISALKIDLKVNNQDGPIAVKTDEVYALTWTTKNASSCTASGAWSGAKTIPTGSENQSQAKRGTYSYTLTCTDASGITLQDSVSVVVKDIPVVDLKLNGSDGPFVYVKRGETYALSWATRNASSCTASVAWSGAKSIPTGSENQSKAKTGYAPYVLTCANSAGETAKDEVTAVVMDPIVDLKVNDVCIEPFAFHTLTWALTNGDWVLDSKDFSCIASGAWSGSKPITLKFPAYGQPLVGNEVMPGKPAGTYTYTLTCTHLNSGFQTQDSVEVIVAEPPEVDLKINGQEQATVKSGEQYKLSWTTENANSCIASGGGWSGAKSIPTGSENRSVTGSGTFSHTLTCTSPVGCKAQDKVWVTVIGPKVTLKVNGKDQETVDLNQNYTLTWTTENVNSCIASGAWSGAKAAGGGSQADSKAVAANYTYIIDCFDQFGGLSEDIVVVKVQASPQPTVDLKVDGQDGPINKTTPADYALSWTSSNASSCSADWTSKTSTSGSEGFSNVNTGTYNYSVTCVGTGGTATDTVKVIVTPTPPTVILKVNNQDQATVTINATYTLTWTTTNVNSCTASNAWSGNKTVPNGSQVDFKGSTGNYTYTLACSGSGGQDQDSVVVDVSAGPACTFWADPTQIILGNSSNLKWQCANADACSINQGIGSVNNVSGIKSVSPAFTAAYTLTCTNNWGADVDQATVRVFDEQGIEIIEVRP